MAVFSVNQNRHLYIAKDYVDGTTKSALTAPGDIEVKTVGGAAGEAYFAYMNPDGEVIKSDYIQAKNLVYAKAVNASAMVTPLKEIELTLDSSVNSGAPVAGQDYVLRINFRQFYGMSDEDQYFKDAAVHVTSAIDNAKKFFDAMKIALDNAFSREVGATKTSNPYLSFTVSGSGSSAKLIIMEKAQDWSLGIGAQERVYFDVVPTTIYSGGDDVIWGTITDVTASNTTVGTDALGNGERIAELEWFCMGERGDQYRYQGWPNYIPTKYVADASTQYHVLELHFVFTDTGVNSYNSEKDITIAVPIGTSNAGKTTLNGIIGKLNTALGTSIGTLA